jgi:Ca-activated chloride channel family protein
MQIRRRWLTLAPLLVAVAAMTPPVQHAQTAPQTDVACNEPALPDVFFSRAETVLRVSVDDGDRRPVVCMTRENFQVWEDGRLQDICFFSNDDLPLTIGLVADARQSDLAALGLTFARARRVDDEFFAIAFDDTAHDLMSADLPFTHDAAVLHDALLHLPIGKGSGLYDAVVHGLDYAARGRLDQRALIVISDGRDTTSRTTFAQLFDRVALSPTVIYTIATASHERAGPVPDALEQLASLSGGAAFSVNASGDIASILEWIARDLRTSYTIGYVPPDPEDGVKFRKLDVALVGRDRAARVRYREGYVGGPR